MTLLRGLSPNSASANVAAGRHRDGGKASVVTSPKAAQQAFVALFGRRKGSA